MDFNRSSRRQNGQKAKGLSKLALLAKGSWKDFATRIIELDSWVAPLIDDFVYIREQQKQQVLSISRNLELLPHGGDIFRRLDMAAQIKLKEKMARGEQIELKDMERFKMDEMKPEPTTVELWILTDGSVSMGFDLGQDGGTRINAALQITAMLREAGKIAEFDTFAGLWGNDKIKMLAAPGDSDETVGENFETNRKGLTAGTRLSPSVREAIDLSSQQETDENGKTKRFAGMTHFVILSDGGLDLDDFEPMVKLLTALLGPDGPPVSVDIAVLNADTKTPMHKLVKAVQDINPAAAIGIVNSDNAEEVPGLVSEAVKQRFGDSIRGVQGRPDAEKRERFRRLNQTLSLG
jgi:hypothetical protein